MLTLYGNPVSRAHRVMWMLKELAVPYTHVPTGFQDGGCRTPEYLRINPNGRVPALVDGDLTLFESLAINLYLAKKFSGNVKPDPCPSGAVEEALATQWSFWVATEVEKPLIFTAANMLLFPPADRRPAEAALGLQRLDRPFAVLEKHFATQDFLISGRFTVADLNVAAVMSLIPLAGISLAPYPKMAAWLDACLQRDAAADWKAVGFTIPRPPDEVLLARFM
jgi:glutathione S-transferase